MLPKIATLNAASSRSGRWTLVLWGVVLFALPTLFTTPGAAITPPPDVPQAEFLPQLSAAEQAIERELDSPTSFDFKDQTLEDVRAALMQRHKFNIVFDSSLEPDPRDSEELAEPRDFTLQVNHIPLRSALKLLFEKHYLVFFVEHDVLKISQETPYYEPGGGTRTYPVRDLVGNQADGFELLIKAIQEGVKPGTWKEASQPVSTSEHGKNSVSGSPPGVKSEAKRSAQAPFGFDEFEPWCTISKVPATGSLVIRTSWQGHAEVLQLLRSLRQAKPDSPIK